jgi:hypothetical protein
MTFDIIRIPRVMVLLGWLFGFLLGLSVGLRATRKNAARPAGVVDTRHGRC